MFHDPSLNYCHQSWNVWRRVVDFMQLWRLSAILIKMFDIFKVHRGPVFRAPGPWKPNRAVLGALVQFYRRAEWIPKNWTICDVLQWRDLPKLAWGLEIHMVRASDPRQKIFTKSPVFGIVWQTLEYAATFLHKPQLRDSSYKQRHTPCSMSLTWPTEDGWRATWTGRHEALTSPPDRNTPQHTHRY